MNNLFLDGHKLIYHLPLVKKWLERKEIVPIHAEISPTIFCNHRCFFCYQEFRERKTSLSRGVLLRLLESLAKVGVKSVLLAGEGEPMVNKYTPEAIVFGAQVGLDMALNSNGVIMTAKIAEEILPHLVWFRFSIMAATPEIYAKIHGTKPQDLERVKENISMCVEIKKRNNLKVTLGIQQVLLTENTNDVFNTVKLAKELGVDYFVLKPFSFHPKNKYKLAVDLYRVHQAELKKAETLTTDKFKVIIRWDTFADEGKRDYDQCLGLPFLVQIASDGGVYSCCPFFGDERFLYGNLYKDSFEKILESKRRKEVIRFVAEKVNVHTDCMTHCRHHNINKFLWQMTHPPRHINFP